MIQDLKDELCEMDWELERLERRLYLEKKAEQFTSFSMHLVVWTTMLFYSLLFIWGSIYLAKWIIGWS